MLSAELRGDEVQWSILKRAGAVGEWFEVMPVAFALAARKRFGLHGDRRMATRFAGRFVARGPGAGEFSPRDVEAVLRGVCGEDGFLAVVGPETLSRIMYAALFALVDDLELDDDGTDRLLVEAERQIAAAYQAVDGPPAGAADAPVVDFDMHRRIHRRYLNDNDLFPDRPSALRRPRSPENARKKQPSTLAGRYLRATLLRDPEERARVGEVSNADLLRIHRSAIAAALARYLHPDPDVREIAAMVMLTRDTFYADLDVMKSEHVARAALGEDVPLDGLTSKDVYLASSLLLLTIADWWNQDDAAISTVAVEAEAAVAASGYTLAPNRG